MDVTPFLHGAHADENGQLRRVSPDVTERWPSDTVQAARVPAGARFAFRGDAEAVEIDIRTASTLALATPAATAGFDVYVNGIHESFVNVAEASEARVRVPLPQRDADSTVELHVPEKYEPRITSLTAIGGAIDTAPRGARWVAYGDSITQGWTSSDPGKAWSAVAARTTGLDLLNLGFAGAARGDLPLASHLAATPADVISLTWGTNCWSQIEMDPRYIGELMRLFLQMVRAGHPETPLLVVSPVIRPAAEGTTNGSGATLAALRTALEESVLAVKEENRDEHLHLLPGLELITAAQLDADGIHPNDEGHGAMASAIAPYLDRIIA